LAKNNENEAKIDKVTYDDLIKAICAYKAIDIMNNECTNKSNYYLMIWLYNGNEPDDFKVKIGMSK